MANQYPMPALTAQQRDKAITFNLRRISSLQNAIEVFDPLDDADRESAINDWQFEILNHQIALAALMAERRLTVSVVQKNERLKGFKFDGHDSLPAGEHEFYTAPPVSALKLPSKVSCEGFNPKEAEEALNLGQCQGWNNAIAEAKRINGVSSEQ